MDIGSLINRGWQKLSADLVNCILLYLVGSLAAGIIGGLTLGILGLPILAGMYKGFRNVARGGTCAVGDAFSEFGNVGYWFKLWLIFVVVFIPMVLIAMIPLLGQLVIGVFGLVMSYLLWFMYPLMIERAMAPLDAIKQSIADMKGNVGALLGPVIITMIVMQAGAIALGLGMLVTAPLGLVMMWLMYDEFYNAAPASSAPASFDSGSTPGGSFGAVPPPPPPPPADTNV